MPPIKATCLIQLPLTFIPNIRKAVGLNRILNKAIKTVLKALIILLANITTTYLLKGKLLEYCKVITTIKIGRAHV